MVAQQRIGEGRATMRIRFVLNDLNNGDDVVETHGFRVFQQINDAIQDAKDYEEALKRSQPQPILICQNLWIMGYNRIGLIMKYGLEHPLHSSTGNGWIDTWSCHRSQTIQTHRNTIQMRMGIMISLKLKRLQSLSLL